MKHKIFKIPMENPDVATDAMNSFCSQHAIESIEKHFVANGDNSFWAFCIKWIDHAESFDKTSDYYLKNKAKVDYQSYFEKPEEFALFDELRQLRNKIAKQNGIPAYGIFTNAQLADMVDQKITTKAELANLDGIGETKLDKYGDKVIELINQVSQRLGLTSS